MFEHPFLLPDHREYAEILTDAAVHVLEMRGVAEFSVAAMARWMKVTPEAVHNLYSRARAIELVVMCFSRRWLHWTLSEYGWLRADHPCPLQLPGTPEERHGVRVLLALTELARGEGLRGNPLPERHLADLRREEAELLRLRLLQMNPALPLPAGGGVQLTGLLALVSGLRTALAAEPTALTLEQASEIFAGAVSAIVGPATGEQTTSPGPHPPHEPAA